MTYDLNITFDDNLVTGNETIDTQHGHIKTYDRSVAEFIFMRENPKRY